ncbi:MAG: hypothetical protein B6U73_01350 [Desulfurococcales archaeon ex4484_204]|nr:MAG: hypothetical protein B6U73_01350 [Desulfurococcales archaeon ex4484_204]
MVRHNLITEILRRFYDLEASYEYIALSYAFLRSRPWPITALLKGETVLDVGSGPCVNGLSLAAMDRGRYVVCTDTSFSMLLTARARARSFKVVSDFVLADVRNLPLRSNSFNTIITIAVLHHIPPDEVHKALSELHRVLRARGLLLVTTWSPWQRIHLRRILLNALTLVFPPSVKMLREVLVPWRTKRLGRKLVLFRYYYLYSKEELERAIKDSGLIIISTGYYSPFRRRSSNVYFIATKKGP